MKKKYPKWFSYHSEPHLRPEPKEPITTYEIHHKVTVIPSYDRTSKEWLMEVDFDFMEVDCDSSDIVLYKIELKDKKPLTYKREYNAYLREKEKWLAAKIEHEKRLAEWHQIKAEIDNDGRIKQEEDEKKLLKKLKEKYE